MRKVLISLLLAVSLPVIAQTGAPLKLEPLPAPPPPSPGLSDADAGEPRINIPVQRGDKVEEVREGGRVVMMKVTPPNGTPYYLMDNTGNGTWIRRDSLDEGVRVPMWTIRTFD
ncbi:MAG: DUF2782 domain-containing protein [Betaproteobacteria bacterium]|nr:DUF2782 domain-containing protein [Betaproteobacteria bacterium]